MFSLKGIMKLLIQVYFLLVTNKTILENMI